MRRLAREERPGPALSERQRAEAPSTGSLRVEAAARRREGPTFPLSGKLFVGYLVIGVALGFALWFVPRVLLWWVATIVVLPVVLGAIFSSIFARVRRLQHLNRAALEISRGDLSKPLGTELGVGRDEIDELAVAVSHMQENLRELVGHIQRTAHSVAEASSDLQSSAEEVNASTEEVALSMKTIARGAGEQTELVGQASKVIGDIAASIQRATRAAEDAARSAGDTSGAAEFSGNAARLAGEKVKKVFAGIEAASKEVFAFGDKTKEINKIVDAITHVAQQTNLLALNATIEAARAGEYGRGFAVVAEEVRKLAESAGRSAEQISLLAGEISDHANAVVAAMREAIQDLGGGREDLEGIVRALETIIDTARKGAEKVAHISEAAREQLKGSEHMVKAITNISGVAQQNATSTQQVNAVIQDQTAAVNQMTGAAQELSNLAVEMQMVATRFKLQ